MAKETSSLADRRQAFTEVIEAIVGLDADSQLRVLKAVILFLNLKESTDG